MYDAPPKVFISYSWTNEAHINWVVRLAEQLRHDGVDVILDQWDLKEGHDNNFFMETMHDPAVVRVLLICDKRYAEKADRREGGVGIEAQIISPDVYSSVQQEKFIPLVRERDAGAACLPTYMRSRHYIDFSDDDEFQSAYEQLVRNIFGQPERVRPAIGKRPVHLLSETETQIAPVTKLNRLREAVKGGKPGALAMLRDCVDSFADALELFRVQYSGDPKAEIRDDEIAFQSISRFIPFRDAFVDLVLFVRNNMDDADSWGVVIEFLEQGVLPKTQPRPGIGFRGGEMDNYKFLANELFLYTVAVLVKLNGFTAAATFINHEYYYAPDGEARQSALPDFNQPNETFDEWRNRRLHGGNSYGVSATLIKDRATHPKVNFSQLFEADVLLFVRSCRPDGRHWLPRCAALNWHVPKPLPLFSRAVSEPGATNLAKLLGFASGKEAQVFIASLPSSEKFVSTANCSYFFRSDPKWDDLLNIPRLRAAVA